VEGDEMTNGKDQAFAVAAYGNNGRSFHEYGLTKREYFAAMAMQGIASDETLSFFGIAEKAVKQADALIDALNKKEK
jgi:hypothetical protein